MRRKIVPVAVALSLVAASFVIFTNLTEIDIIARQSLRAFVPQAWQDALRPFRAPMVIGFSPDWEATDVARRSPVSVTFLTPMNTTLTENSVRIEPAVDGHFTWRGRTLIFTPVEDWPMQTGVTVTVSRGARSWLLRRMETEFSYRFVTLGPPFVVETEPAQDAKYTYLRDRLTVVFNRAMDHESVESRLQISPEIARQRLAWRNNELIISGVLRASTEYHVTIDEGATDTAYHLETAEDFEWSFTTTERSPYLTIPGIGREALVSADVPAELQLSLVNVSRVDLELYDLDVATHISMTNFSFDDWRSFAPEGEWLRAWSVDPQASLDRDEERTLELGSLEPGLYYLRARSPEQAQDAQILIASHMALTVKRTARQALVWATSLADGRPLAGLPLTLYDGDAHVVATGLSNADGVFSTDIQGSESGLFVLAQTSSDLGLCSDKWREGIEPWRFESTAWQWDVGEQSYRLFLYSDRSMYRPGQRVYFKGVLRQDIDGDYSMPPLGTAVQVTVANYENNVIYERVVRTNAFGTINGELALNDELEPGEYFLKAKVEDQAYETVFQVEEYRKPEFTVWVTTDTEAYVDGDVITATVSAGYSFGAPVVGALVQYTLYSNDHAPGWGDSDSSLAESANARYGGFGRELASGEGVTDDAGDFALALRADITREERSQIFTLEATVTDASNQPVTGMVSFVVHRGQFYIGLQPERRVVLPEQRAVVRVRTLDTEGDPVGNLDLSYKVYLVEWRRVDRTGQAQAYLDWLELLSEVKTARLRTGEDGYAIITFAVAQGGTYRVQVQGRDRGGNRVIGTTYLWASDVGRSVAWRLEEHDRIELVTDKASYTVGDTARILIQSPYERATGLVTIERARVISYYVVDMEGNSSVVEIPVEPAYSPNVFVSVVLAPRGPSGVEPPGFKIGYAELDVEASENELKITITPDQQEYRPREMARYTIRTSDHLNRPVSAEVSLGVIDAARYPLAGDEGYDIVDAFRGRRRLAVRTAHSLTIHADRLRPLEDFGGGGGIGEQEPPHIFPDIAYWNPTVVTDQNGEARVEFQMPDNLTAWRAFAQGVTVDTLVGAADNDVITTKDLVLRPLVPRFLSVGDKAVIGAVVYNNTKTALEARVSLTATNLVLPAQLSYTVAISPEQAVEVNWPVEAAGATTTTVTMIADGRRARDVAQRTLPLLPFGESKLLLDAAVLDGEETSLLVSLPANARFASLEIDVAPSLAAGLVDSTQYLSDSPYGSVEQTVSGFLPAVLVGRVLARLGVENENQSEELQGYVERGLQRLYRFQHYDGGWGWWQDDESQAYQTAYVVYGLAQTRNSGFEVNEEALRRGEDFLRQSLVETNDLDLKAYIGYVLTEGGEGDLSLARSLFQRRKGMALYAQAYLALALGKLGGSQEARAVVDGLASVAIETAHTAHWEEENHDPAAMSSDGRTTALILQAVLAIDPESALIPKTVRWLMWLRPGGYWHSTHETATAVMALAEYLASSRELETGFSYRVFVNGEPIDEDVATRENITQHRTLKVADLHPGDNEIRVVKEGRGQLYVATALQYYGETDRVEAARSLSGPLVQRRYEDPVTGALLTKCAVGDLIRVRLTVEVPRDLWYVVVEDPLPAGTEPVNGTVRTTAVNEGAGQHELSYSDLRDDRALFFSTLLGEGMNEYTYLVRATVPGTYSVMPAQAMPIYESRLWGRSGSARLLVGGQ